MPIQAIGASAVPGVQQYYVAPPNAPNNVFAQAMAGYLQIRTPAAMQVFAEKLKAQDPRARLAAHQQLDALRAASAKEAADTSKRLSTASASVRKDALAEATKLAIAIGTTSQRGAEATAKVQQGEREFRAIPANKREDVDAAKALVANRAQALMSDPNNPALRGGLTQALEAIRGPDGIKGLERQHFEAVGDELAGTIDTIVSANPDLRTFVGAEIRSVLGGAGEASQLSAFGDTGAARTLLEKLQGNLFGGESAKSGRGGVGFGAPGGARAQAPAAPGISHEDIDRAFDENQARFQGVNLLSGPLIRDRTPLHFLRSNLERGSETPSRPPPSQGSGPAQPSPRGPAPSSGPRGGGTPSPEGTPKQGLVSITAGGTTVGDAPVPGVNVIPPASGSSAAQAAAAPGLEALEALVTAENARLVEDSQARRGPTLFDSVSDLGTLTPGELTDEEFESLTPHGEGLLARGPGQANRRTRKLQR